MEPKPTDAPAPHSTPRPEPPPRRKPYAAPSLTRYGPISMTVFDLGSLTDQRSDRHAKEGFAPVDPAAVLARVAALPIETWSYKGEPVRHLGPMAQDFAAAFGLGADDRHIHTLDAAGVALAAIQGLQRQLQAQAARVAALEGECAALRAELRAAAARDPDAPALAWR
ncbi:MAG TPA: tail fiber domain-containing protein [Methylomirabilota bacterium]|jgi:hypothetical protein|nr:tail fiber domain-containing protein [Methylomirabilota bacterium]